jgi:riboflavin biosynthesis pyrimidine reductase
LDVRYDLEGPSPRPIVWDPKGKTMDSPWWQEMEMRSPVVVTQVKSMGYPSFVEVLELDDPSALGRELFALGIHHVLVEGGAGLHGWMMDGGCADALQVFVAPKVCGGKGSLSPVGGEGVSKMNEALVGLDLELQKIGNDVWMSTVFKRYHPSF